MKDTAARWEDATTENTYLSIMGSGKNFQRPGKLCLKKGTNPVCYSGLKSQSNDGEGQHKRCDAY